MSDVTAAERARRYRSRRRERDAAVTSREPELVAVVGQLVAEIRALGELVRAGYPQPAPAVGKRDVTAVTLSERDVTKASRAESARAPVRVRARLTGPTGPSEPVRLERDVTPAEQILETLRRAHEPATAAAIADAVGLGTGPTLAVLVELQGAGLVRRVAGATPAERDRWQPAQLVESPSETIRCADYRAHAIAGHRRDPASGRFRCYLCEPEAGQLTASM